MKKTTIWLLILTSNSVMKQIKFKGLRKADDQITDDFNYNLLGQQIAQVYTNYTTGTFHRTAAGTKFCI